MRTGLLLKFAICALLLAITWAVFGQTLGHGFVNFDDQIYVTENEHVYRGLNWQSVGWAFTHIHSSNWHPLTSMTHMLDCQLFGLRPGWHHFVNVFLHSVGAILLFLALNQMAGDGAQRRNLWASAFVAAVFAVHPLRVESVAWISERKDVLSGVFFMLTLLAYFRYSKKPSFGRLIVVLVVFACGLMSKPMLVTVPMILFLLDYWPLGRFSRANLTRLLIEKIPLCILSIASAVVTLLVQNQGIGLVRLEVLPFSWRITNALATYLIYIWQMIWPNDLALAYSHPGKLSIWQIAGAASALIALTLLVFALRKRSPYLLVGWCWYLVMLIPVIGLVQVGGQAHADRYTYLPQIGLYIALTWGIVDLSSRWRYRGPFLGSAAALILSALAVRAAGQASYWHDSEKLWRHTLAVTTANDVAHLAFGQFLLNQNHLNDAISELEIVVARHPSDVDARLALASALSEKKGRMNDAIAQYEAAAKIGEPNPEVETALANLLLEQGRVEEAIRYYRHIMQLQPSSALAHYNLAVGLHRDHQLPEAIFHYKEALKIDPHYPDADYFLGQALSENGQPDEAKVHLDKH